LAIYSLGFVVGLVELSGLEPRGNIPGILAEVAGAEEVGELELPP
jgi:hypothetical protein